MNRQLKGKCYNCAEPGHQAPKCAKPKKKNNGRQQRRNVKCYICGGNQYATNCPQNIFLGVTRIIREKTKKEKIEDIKEINKLKLVNC